MNTAGGGSAKGFLARVVDRAHGAATVVAPRLPGLFEPVFSPRPSTDTMRADGFATDALDTEPRVASPQFGDALATSRSDTSRDGVGVRPARGTRSRKTKSDDTEPESVRESFAARSTSSPVATGEQVAPTPLVTPTVVDLRPRAALVAPAPKAYEAASSNDNSRREHAHHDTDDASAQRAHAPSTPATQTLPSQQTLAQGVLVPKFVPLQAPRTNVRAEGDRRPSESAPARAEPTVHISIGRIEVRAPQQPAATALRAPRTQRPMSLDEYLERKERAR